MLAVVPSHSLHKSCGLGSAAIPVMIGELQGVLHMPHAILLRWPFFSESVILRLLCKAERMSEEGREAGPAPALVQMHPAPSHETVMPIKLTESAFKVRLPFVLFPLLTLPSLLQAILEAQSSGAACSVDFPSLPEDGGTLRIGDSSFTFS